MPRAAGSIAPTVNLQHVAVQKKHGAQRLVLCRSAHVLSSQRTSTGRSSSGLGLKGRFPGILDPAYGKAARELYEHAQGLLTRIVDKLITARGVYGFWPANADGDDIVVFKDDSRGEELSRFPMLRQQEVIADGRPNRSLADFIAPRDSGVPDYLGVFAVTAGIGVDDLVRRFEQDHDDYNAIMVKRWPIDWPRHRW